MSCTNLKWSPWHLLKKLTSVRNVAEPSAPILDWSATAGNTAPNPSQRNVLGHHQLWPKSNLTLISWYIVFGNCRVVLALPQDSNSSNLKYIVLFTIFINFTTLRRVHSVKSPLNFLSTLWWFFCQIHQYYFAIPCITGHNCITLRWMLWLQHFYNININFLPMISIPYQEIRLWELINWSPSGNALIFCQILLTYSLRKCIETSLEKLFVIIGDERVK